MTNNRLPIRRVVKHTVYYPPYTNGRGLLLELECGHDKHGKYSVFCRNGKYIMRTGCHRCATERKSE